MIAKGVMYIVLHVATISASHLVGVVLIIPLRTISVFSFWRKLA